MKNLKVILLNPDTNETVETSPTVMTANIKTSPRHVQLVMEFNGMTHEDFKKLAVIAASAF